MGTLIQDLSHQAFKLLIKDYNNGKGMATLEEKLSLLLVKEVAVVIREKYGIAEQQVTQDLKKHLGL